MLIAVPFLVLGANQVQKFSNTMALKDRFFPYNLDDIKSADHKQNKCT